MKNQLKERMRKDRYRNHIEMEKQMKLYNEELCTDEEDEWDDDGGESISSESDENNDDKENNDGKENNTEGFYFIYLFNL